MHALSSPATVFVVMIGVLLPALAWRGRRAFSPGASRPELTRGRYYGSAYFTQFATLAFALLVARDVGLDPFAGRLELAPLPWLATAAVLGGLLATMPLRWRTRTPEARRRQSILAPRTPSQAAVNAGLCLLAGFGEEITWRGVLHACVWWATDSWWIATAGCAVSFGVAHAIQGRRAVLLVTGVAVWMHVIVLWTGSLYLAMVAHAVYDLVATFTIARWVRRDEAAQAAAPAQA